MQYFFIFLLLMGSKSFASDEPRKEFHLCYFSLNNEKEFGVMKDFSAKLNKVSATKINITEYQTRNSDPNESFKKMIKSGVKCDGLVISGHHTGAFGGERAVGELSIGILEDLSCDPKYEKFFRDINALWLQGCRTLGGKISSSMTADQHARRVGLVAVEDHLSQTQAQFAVEFSATLDQDNPLSSRYLRIFPTATVFGWTASAPGEKARSEHSVPFHIAHISRLVDEKKFENPMEAMDEATKIIYASMFELQLKNKAELISPCIGLAENLGIDGWLYHGQAKTNPQGSLPFSFANPDLMAYPSIAAHKDKNKTLFKARELSCRLKEDIKPPEVSVIVDDILNDDDILKYNFNSIIELFYRSEKESEISSIRRKIERSKKLKDFLKRKFADNKISILRKIDYYALYREISKNNVKEEEQIEILKKQAFEILTNPIKSHDHSGRDFMLTILQSLAKHGILNSTDYKTLVEQVKDSFVLKKITYYFLKFLPALKIPIREKIDILNSFLDSSILNFSLSNYFALDVSNLNNMLDILDESNIELKKEAVEKVKNNMLEILDSLELEAWDLESLSDVFNKLKIDSEEKAKIDQKTARHMVKILNRSKINLYSLTLISGEFFKLKISNEEKEKIFKKMPGHLEEFLNSPNLNNTDAIALKNMARDLITLKIGSKTQDKLKIILEQAEKKEKELKK